ncbi:hypothetical protein K2173_019762 [Erythroxylum novogranatense]|uniref:FAM86 N-terminal domain-containing protein n=1 Tax=Erythroxylum novogranatense TaxID=1862640 RepID=A0AAV8SN54_9ROSI|nr:hypothetical protein K2173_019762 [Erythroxylum novogranatense]
MAAPELSPHAPPGLYLVSAFLAMEPTHSILSLARVCGGGSVTERVQKFIWGNCFCKTDGNDYAPYSKNFLKKLICEIESSHVSVMDELYELYGYYMTSLKDYSVTKENSRVYKSISFIFPDGSFELPSCPKSSKLVVPLYCSLNMLEGDTGCSLWPSSLYLSEFMLSFPDIFLNKSCFEIGSGVGLVGICLSYVKVFEVTLSDGDLSTLANMKLNLELYQRQTGIERSSEALNKVNCIHLPWESAAESELLKFTPDIILGADIIYDPLCLPHLVRVLAILLNQTKTDKSTLKDTQKDSSAESICGDQENVLNKNKNGHGHRDGYGLVGGYQDTSFNPELKKGRVAYISSVIRNIDTFNYFLKLTEEANLAVSDVTEALRPFELLPYMESYNRSSIRLFTVTRK